MILVTGGTGFIGRQLLPTLVREGRPVRILSRRDIPGGLPAGFEVARGDLQDPRTLSPALCGVDTVIHLAAHVPADSGDHPALHHVNVEGTRALATAAATAGVGRFVHLSSAGVYGPDRTCRPLTEDAPCHPLTPYERSKAAAEAIVTEVLGGRVPHVVLLRPAGVYGAERPATRALFDTILHRRLWLHGPGVHMVHPTHVTDLVHAIVRSTEVIESGVVVCNIGGERALPFPELVALIARRAGRRSPRQWRAPSWLGIPPRLLSSPWRVVGARPPALLERLATGAICRILDTSRARATLGFTPLPLEEGIDLTLAGLGIRVGTSQ